MGKASRAKRPMGAREARRRELYAQVDRAEVQAGEAVVKSRLVTDVERLAQAWQIREQADRDVRGLVATLRASGVTWDAIGTATGISKQLAIYRWKQPKRA
jgi:hypothetical protein